MRITFVTDMGESYPVEIDSQMEIENIMALLEAESGIPTAEQSISFEGRELDNPKATIRDYRIGEDAILLLRRRVTVAGRSGEQDAEMMRLQLLGDAELMQQLRATQPELVDAAQNNPDRFAQLLSHTRERQQEVERRHQMEIAALNADPFNLEAQRRIEEAIREQAVLENMEHALEYSPEAFGRVTMLYIPVEVNGISLVAFVDSGAQQTIMSPEYAEKCGIMRLIDRRFSGVARGVGTAKILGRIHTAQMKLGNIHLPCSYTIMEGRDVDLLLGLDMLKSHRACVDLDKNCLRIQGQEIPFLAEHELPEKAKQHTHPELEEHVSQSSTQAGPSNQGDTHFPGTGNAVGSAPTSQQRSPYSEEMISALINLGATREQAIQCLQEAGGNVDVAASLLFN